MRDESTDIQLIQPVQQGAALIDDIQTTVVPPGSVALWWLGQSGYAMKTASALWYVDLYLSEHLTRKYADTEKPHVRMTASPLHGTDITNAQNIFASHKHSDHLDPGTLPDLMRVSPNARLILPAIIRDYAIETLGLPANRLIPMRGDETTHLIEQLSVHAIPSAHPTFESSAETGYPFLGFVFQIDGVTIYHSGDTLAYDGLAERLRPFSPDILFLPINGTTERLNALGTPPNMSMDDAIGLALAVGDGKNVPLVIPHHYDMFTFNTVDVTLFEERAKTAGILYHVLQCGERFIFTRTAEY